MKLKTIYQLFTSRFKTNVKKFDAEVNISNKYSKNNLLLFLFADRRILFLLFCFIYFSSLSQVLTVSPTTSATTSSWVCPTGVTSIIVECWGGGGQGGGTNGATSFGGGGGGAYSKSIISVTPGTTYYYSVAGQASGGSTTGTTGQSTWFNASTTSPYSSSNTFPTSTSTGILAVGGSPGSAGTGGAGGSSGSCYGTTKYSGGNGANANWTSGGGTGGGGGGGGNSANGSNASAPTLGTGGTSNGGNGGSGYSYTASPSLFNGNIGTSPAGGGSGAYYCCGSNPTGGKGAAGKLILTLVNDDCSNAISIPCSTSNLAGSTVGSVSESAPLGVSSNFGVWYKFTGDGASTTISTTAGSGFDHELLIMSGTTCGATYTQIADIDNALSAGTETYTFTSVLNTQYYVYIAYYGASGTSSNTGTFTISRSCVTPQNISWTGGTSIQWSTASNWSTNTVPTSIDNVTIPSGTTYSPTISTTTLASCKNLTINSGATLTYAPNCSGTCSYYLDIYGNLINNGTLTQAGTSPIFFNTSSTTISGSGDMSTVWLSIFACNVTLASNITVNKFTIFDNSSTINLSTFTLIVSSYLDQSGTLALNSGTIEYRGTSANHTFNDSYLTEGTGTFYYNGVTNSQTVKTGTYYNLKIATISGNTATIGSSAASTVSNDLTIINPSTAGGIASLAYDINVTGNTYIGNTGNALTLNMPNRIIGTGTFTMGNVAAHAINISYASASNFALTCSGTPIFYGTVTYTSASAQKVITATTYNNLTFDLAGNKTLFGNLDVNGNLTLTAGTLDVSTFNVNLAGDFVKQSAATFTANTAIFTFDGTATQYVNVTAAGGSTACDSDVTFYNLVIDGTDVRVYYNKTNNRKINTNDFTVNSGKQVSVISQ